MLNIDEGEHIDGDDARVSESDGIRCVAVTVLNTRFGVSPVIVDKVLLIF